MDLISLLFPGLKKFEYVDEIPILEDNRAPWKILDKNHNKSLNSQLMGIKSENDESKYIGISLDETKGPIFIHPTAIIDPFVRIEGPTYVGENVHIRHCAYLRSGCWISRDSVVGHCTEIKNSLLLPGSKAPHFNYVGDSILGFKVNLGAGTKLSNVRNDKREIIVTIQDGIRINSGLKKFGSLIGDKVEIGCNTVTNPGTIIQVGSMIMPNSTLKGWN